MGLKSMGQEAWDKKYGLERASVRVSIQAARLKVGIRYWRSSLNRKLYVGTSDMNYQLPDKLGATGVEIEVEDELKKLSRRNILSAPSKSVSINSTLIEILDSLNLIDRHQSNLEYQSNENRITNLQESDRKSLALANYIERAEIESAGISHLPGIRDGGVSAFLNRRDFGIEIYGAGRLAVSIFGALIASGFSATTIKVSERLEVTNRDFIGGFLQRQDLGSNLGNALLKLRNGSSIFPITSHLAVNTSLVISIGRPSPELLKNWLEARIPQLYIDFEHPGLLRIGPFVRPGFGPCCNCIYLSEAESGSPAFGLIEESTEPHLELATSLSLTGAGAIATEVARFAATGESELHKKSIRITLADFYAPQVTTWERHPRCGCNWI